MSSPYRPYLDRYAEPLALALDSGMLSHHQFVLVIPAHNEPPNSLEKVLPPDL
jgi:hypothetical protein